MTEQSEPQELQIASRLGPIDCRYHPAEGASAAVVMVGGGDGGFDGPDAVFPEIAAGLNAAGIAALRLDFRVHQFPGNVEDGIHDVLAGMLFLVEDGATRIGLVGHSFGGAVVIEAGVRAPTTASVVTLATQTAGAQRVGELAPTSLLLIHGLADTRLSPECSRQLHHYAGEPKRLELLKDATHSLRQRHDDVLSLTLDWLVETLSD